MLILINEDPKQSTFKEVACILDKPYIDPLDLIDPESHMLTTIYEDIFVSELANQLMSYLINKQDRPMVFDIVERIHSHLRPTHATEAHKEKIVLLNVTLLRQEDIDFIIESFDHVLAYTLHGSAQFDARNIYDGIKKYND